MAFEWVSPQMALVFEVAIALILALGLGIPMLLAKNKMAVQQAKKTRVD
eukprot:CAMPEP_0114154934 /NCGR_PEP_ID=MMETSP0043_2-20121206/25187_1 /TAXON_ID=464988 /ORGANISM="Hemiselmis andersenii, Strain CCMP644" /LENGTH=48 /DNA_ID= /DNA_START= /DNA_END= /DNA_ORIENTATION=